MENNKKNSDPVDMLLELASAKAGEEDILQYKKERSDSGISADMLKDITEDKKEKRRPHLSLRHKLLIAAAAMLSVGLIVFAAIAGRNAETATPNVQSAAKLVVTFELDGIKSLSELPDTDAKVTVLPDRYVMTKKEGDKKGYTITYSNGTDIMEFSVSPISSDYFYELAKAQKTKWENIEIAEKYSGIAAQTDTDGTTLNHVIWNDGKRIYSLCGTVSVAELCNSAQSVHEK